MSVGEVPKAVEEANRKFGAAVQRKNYAELASLFTNDAKVLAPDAPIVTGRNLQ